MIPTNTEPLVTIGVLTYNHAAFIVECLDGIRRQTYGNIELLISDDGSSDKTRQVIDDYIAAHPNVVTKFYKQEVNLGVARNCNFLLKRATGNYVQIFSGDDLMHIDKIEHQVTALERDPRASFSYTNMAWFRKDPAKPLAKHYTLLSQSPPRDLNDLVKENTLASPTYLMRRECLPDCLYDERLKIINDYKIGIDMMQAGRGLYIDKVLVFYRKHGQAITARSFFYEDRMTLHNILKAEYKNHISDDALKTNMAVCVYARIRQNILARSFKNVWDDMRNIWPYFFTSMKWFARLMLIIRDIIKVGLSRA